MSITGVVHTKNEATDIARALRSLREVCDELLVPDMGSTDETREIARSLGARVMDVPDFGYVEPARALALAEVRTEWVLTIDADEIVPPRLAERLRRVASEDEADAVNICRLNFMFGAPLRGTGWTPDRHLFFFKPSRLTPPAGNGAEIHVPLRARPDARVLDLPQTDLESIWHFNYSDWAHFITKMNRYTSIEASQYDSRADVRYLLGQVMHEIVSRGLYGRAWKDGYRGLGLVAMMCTYRLTTWLKARQLADVGDDDAILAHYRALADEVLLGRNPLDEPSGSDVARQPAVSNDQRVG